MLLFKLLVNSKTLRALTTLSERLFQILIILTEKKFNLQLILETGTQSFNEFCVENTKKNHQLVNMLIHELFYKNKLNLFLIGVTQDVQVPI